MGYVRALVSATIWISCERISTGQSGLTYPQDMIKQKFRTISTYPRNTVPVLPYLHA